MSGLFQSGRVHENTQNVTLNSTNKIIEGSAVIVEKLKEPVSQSLRY